MICCKNNNNNIGGHDYDEGDMMADMICCRVIHEGCSSCCLVMIEVKMMCWPRFWWGRWQSWFAAIIRGVVHLVLYWWPWLWWGRHIGRHDLLQRAGLFMLSCDNWGCLFEDEVLAKVLMRAMADMICCMTSLGQWFRLENVVGRTRMLFFVNLLMFSRSPLTHHSGFCW